MMDYCVGQNWVLVEATRISIQNKLAQCFLMWPKRNFPIRGMRTHAGAEQDAEMEELERDVVHLYPVNTAEVPWVRQRCCCDPLSAEGLFIVFVEVLFTSLAKEVLLNSILDGFPTSVPTAVNSHEMTIIIVVKLFIKKLRNDV